MKRLPTIILFLALSVPAFAATAPPASIQFDQIGTVQKWRAGGDNIIYVQDAGGQWYKAVMLETCMTLNTKNGVNFVTEVDPATDEKTSKVMVDHHICTVDTLTRVDAPPPAAAK